MYEDGHLEAAYEDRFTPDYETHDFDEFEEDEDEGTPFDPAFYEADVPSWWDRALAGGLVTPFTST